MTSSDQTSLRNRLPSFDRRTFGKAALALATCARSARALAAPASPEITPFTYRASAHALLDLKRRLWAARWPEPETVEDSSQGVPIARLAALAKRWATRYDWRACEARLNALPQYRTEIDDLTVHFLHVRSPHEDALPLLLTHGWPSSVLDFLRTIPQLTDPTEHGGVAADAFHVIVPSLPGFAFSEKPSAPGWNIERIARAWSVLMQRLGYERWVAQGGDWGAFVTTRLAQQRAPGLAAIHLNFLPVVPDPLPAEPTAEEQRALASLQSFRDYGMGYFDVQATRPQNVGYALSDSPVGQLAWLAEHYLRPPGVEGGVSEDDLLDQTTLYWLTNSAASSARIYWEQHDPAERAAFNLGRVELPVGCSLFPNELMKPPRSWAEQLYPNLFYWNEVERGGHFAAFEEPALFARELRSCFLLVR